MPTPKKGPRLGGSAKHHNMIMSNLATELFRHGRITTTKAKAKTVQPVAERMITFAKRGDLHARRQVLTVIRDKDVVHKLFADIGPAAATRNGGYTRVVKLGPRKGDGAEMAMIELVDILESESGETLTEAPTRRWSLRRRRNNLSRTAREREQAILAAEDSGDWGEEDSVFAASSDEPEVDESLSASQITERNLAREAEAASAEDETEASPDEVDARLAADDNADDADTEAADAEAAESEAGDADADGAGADDTDDK